MPFHLDPQTVNISSLSAPLESNYRRHETLLLNISVHTRATLEEKIKKKKQQWSAEDPGLVGSPPFAQLVRVPAIGGLGGGLGSPLITHLLSELSKLPSF